MKLQFDQNQFEEIVKTSAQMGATMFAVDHGLVKTKITRAEAYRRYSKWLVDRWINEGRVKPIKDGGFVLLDVKELEATANINKLYEKFINPQLNKK